MKYRPQIGICCFLIIVAASCRGQVPGCTDPLAYNYDPSATVNDGSCTYDPYSVSPSRTIQLSELLAETSGLILWDGYVWTQNDNLDTTIYGLDPVTAEIKKSYKLEGVVNKDWEEIQQDNEYIYIGDFGNNTGDRTDLCILRINKPSLKSGASVIDTIWFSYSDQLDFHPKDAQQTDFDCEAFIVLKDSIYLFTKQWISAHTGLYSLPKVPGSYVARKINSYDTQGLITGATYMDSYDLVVLCGYTSLLHPFLWLLYDYIGDNFFSGNKRRITVSLPFHQVEGITTLDGMNYYVSNEAFYFQPAANSPQKLHLFDLKKILSGYIETTSALESNYQHDEIRIYPNPASGFIIVRLPVKMCPNSYRVYDQSSKIVQEGKLEEENIIIDIKRMVSGSYILMIEGHGHTFHVLNR